MLQIYDNFFLRHCKRNEAIQKNRIFCLFITIKRGVSLSLKILICKLACHFWPFAKSDGTNCAADSLAFLLDCRSAAFDDKKTKYCMFYNNTYNNAIFTTKPRSK
jgi:hypothetical protein